MHYFIINNTIIHTKVGDMNRLLFKTFIFLFLISCNLLKDPNYSTQKKWQHVTEKPYVINGVRYTPQTHYNYEAVGYTSWYGDMFHGRQTATGKIFHKDMLSAAHRTLPLPSVIKVTNLKNGRSVILVVNDRGPFAQTNRRIIDVSEKAARILGMHSDGVAKVRVTCFPAESRQMARKYGKTPY